MGSIQAIRHEEVLRYLGHRGQAISDDLMREVLAGEADMLACAKPKSVFSVFDRIDTTDGIALSGTTLVLKGEDIKNHLVGCTKVAILAVTLSFDVDRLITSAQVESMSRSLILDASADALIEQVCDEVEREIYSTVQDMHATWRFSPGYGDFPISLQNEILTVLSAQKCIGLCATDSHLLTPRKSVTAVIGLSDIALPKKQRGCESCTMRETCTYRKRGERCVWK